MLDQKYDIEADPSYPLKSDIQNFKFIPTYNARTIFDVEIKMNEIYYLNGTVGFFYSIAEMRQFKDNQVGNVLEVKTWISHQVGKCIFSLIETFTNP